MGKRFFVVAWSLLGLGSIIIGALQLFLPGKQPLPPFYGIANMVIGAVFILFAFLYMRRKP